MAVAPCGRGDVDDERRDAEATKHGLCIRVVSKERDERKEVLKQRTNTESARAELANRVRRANLTVLPLHFCTEKSGFQFN